MRCCTRDIPFMYSITFCNFMANDDNGCRISLKFILYIKRRIKYKFYICTFIHKIVEEYSVIACRITSVLIDDCNVLES